MWTKSTHSGATNCIEIWRRACHANNTCIEVRTKNSRLLIRDSKNPTHPYLAVNPSFIKEIKARSV